MATDDETTPPAPPVDDEGNPIQLPAELRSAYDRTKTERDQARAEAEAGRLAQRELAFLRAGIDTENPVGKLFAASYDGPLEKAEIEEAWKGLNYTPPTSETTPPDPDAQTRADLQDVRRDLQGEGIPPGTEPDVDPIEKGWREGHGAGPRGSDRAIGTYFQEMLNAAGRNDPRVVHTGVVDDDTRRQWMEDARQRQIRNRDRQKRSG